MSLPPVDQLFVCYIPTLDLRRIDKDTTPYISKLLEDYSWSEMTNLPESHLVQTLVTGTPPHVHGFSQVKLKESEAPFKLTAADKIPDWLSTTYQCFVHLFTGSFDLAAVPHRRRRLMELKRTKYMTTEQAIDLIAPHAPTIFNIVGKGRSRWIYCRKYHKLKNFIPGLFAPDNRLELFEIYALDVTSHWNLDHPKIMKNLYRKIDSLVQDLHQKAKQNNFAFLLLSDHGQEPVKGTIDIKKKLNHSKIPKNEYLFFVHAVQARFWFFTDRARKEITAMLSAIPNGQVLSYKDLHNYNMKFPDNRYGDTFFLTEPGYIMFPNDFYHPLANLFLGLDRQQYRRIWSPHQKGYHGYLPSNDCEKGFMLITNDHFKLKKNMNILDFAPSVLELLGYRKSDKMQGQSVIEEKVSVDK
ncbi:MAG: hypothetical protein C4518_16960 [Desulfobacteraceae bacterium]|nr:MAG: hypothetical protein C4518_16960 [Desulfobacteraceae bacterium]